MTSFGKGIIEDAAIRRQSFADVYCTAKKRNGEHNNIEVRHWFRRFKVCASCGFVERTG